MSETGLRSDNWEARLAIVTFLACLSLYLAHFLLIWRYAVDVPYWDEWAMFGEEQLPASFSLQSIGSQHLEHRFATTKLLIWLQYVWNGWDIRVHQELNFVLFGVLLIAIGLFIRRNLAETPWWLLFAFLLFGLSPIHSANHFMAYQTSTHLYLLFTVAAVWLIFAADATTPRLLLGGLVCIALTFTHAAGVAATLVVGGMFLVHEWRGPTRRRRLRSEIVRLAAVLLPILVATFAWFADYRHDADFPALTFPTSGAYWRHFMVVVSFGFGIETDLPVLGAVCIASVLTPLVLSGRSRHGTASSWAPLVVSLALFGGVAALSVGRANFGVTQARSQRYAEYLFPLIPLSGAAWYRLLSGHRDQQLRMTAILWIFCCVAFADDWLLFRFYQRESLRREAGLDCVQRYYEGTSDGVCPTIFPEDFPGGLTPFLDAARELNASFTREETGSRHASRRPQSHRSISR